MFFKYLDPLLAPFRKLRSEHTKVANIKGNIKMDAKRVQNVGAQAKMHAKAGQDGMNKAAGMAGKAGGAINPKPGVKKVGLFGRKRVCEQCGQALDKSWDSCPFCAQAAAAQAPAAAPAMKTQAFMVDASGAGTGMRMLGWIVPVKGPQRGQLFTLAPISLVGTEANATVQLNDQYMSSKHAEIKAEGGNWILRDLGSTNGTFVNDKRIDKHELVDNDFVKFGQTLVKFKSL
jgi:hypothetical protein